MPSTCTSSSSLNRTSGVGRFSWGVVGSGGAGCCVGGCCSTSSPSSWISFG